MDVPDAPRPRPEEPRLTLPQRRIAEALFDLGSEELAHVYLGALRILSQPRFPGAACLVGHACREIYNRLPDRLNIPIPRGVQYADMLDPILHLWKDEAPAIGAQGEPVKISAELYRELEQLIRQHEDSRSLKRRERRTAVFRALGKADERNDSDSSEPDLEDWITLGDGLHKLAHLRAKGQGPPTLDDARAALALLERVLWRRLVRPLFYEGVEALDEILQEANQRGS